MLKWVAVKFARALKIAQELFCKKTLLPKVSLSHKDTYAGADNFARRHFKGVNYFLLFINFVLSLYIFIYLFLISLLPIRP